MNPAGLILPRVRSCREKPGAQCCHLAKISWLEAAPEDAFAAARINTALELVGQKTLPVIERVNLGTRNRVSLQLADGFAPERYELAIDNEMAVIRGGSHAAIFYGAQSLAQIIACSAHLGGHELYLPPCVIDDEPRFSWRGLMLDSSRQFQPKKIIFALLDRMAEYKLNVFHWHFVDRQGWRPVFDCAPELAEDPPKSRCYSFGIYTKSDLIEIRDYAAARFIRVVPELEMPGHSAMVFRTHPELACPVSPDPFAVDTWEYCIGNPAVETFLKKLLAEIAEIFPDSKVIHIGGDEAGIEHWRNCPVCQKAIRERGLNGERALEHDFMKRMSEAVAALGRDPMSWGTDSEPDFPAGMILQDWLGGNTLRAVRAGRRVVSSVHRNNYFDYPNGDFESVSDWQKTNYEFDPVPAETTDAEAQLILGGEGCIWTEQLPPWRILPRALPRMRALAEMLWTPKKQCDFADFQLRERLITSSGLTPWN